MRMVGSSPIDLQFNLPLIPWRESEEEREKRRERDESFFHPKLWGTIHEPKGDGGKIIWRGGRPKNAGPM
jgi:hypothetical protein